MAYDWDTFPTYNLARADLETYLTKKFGHFDFFIKVDNGKYYFWIQRKLTTAEQHEIAALRKEPKA